LKKYEQRKTVREIPQWLGIPRTIVFSVISKYKRTGEIEARSRGGARNIKLNQLDKEKISRLVDENACIYLKEFNQVF